MAKQAMRPADPFGLTGRLTSSLAHGVRHLARGGRSFQARPDIVKASRFLLV